MKFERFTTRVINGFEYFGIACIGASLAMIIEYGFEFTFISILALSTFILIATSSMLKWDKEEEKRLKVAKENKRKIILYNAISLLTDETFEQYDNSEDWLVMIYNELGCTEEDLKSFGIKITIDGGIYYE